MTDYNEFANQIRNLGHNEYRRQVEQEFAPREGQFFFSPYVPLTSTPVVLDPDSFRSREILTRYSRESLEAGARNYSRISVSNWWEENVGTDNVIAPAAINPTWHRKTYDLGPPERVNWLKEGF